MILSATCSNTKQLVITVIDEAFGLLLIENYIAKWISTKFECQERKGQPTVQDGNKYTALRAGNSEFGGWTKAGVRRFTALCKHVEIDRKSIGGRRNERNNPDTYPAGRKVHEKLEMLANGRLNGNVSGDKVMTAMFAWNLFSYSLCGGGGDTVLFIALAGWLMKM
jgi:hypothetical protein